MKKININYLCVSKLFGKDDFILLKEKFSFKKFILGNSNPFYYCDLRDSYKTKYTSNEIEEAYDYKSLLCLKQNIKENKDYLLDGGLEKAKKMIIYRDRNNTLAQTRLK